MKIIKGFITNSDFIDNTVKTVAPIYELSDYCMTFSKEKKLFKDNTKPLYELIVFKLEDITTLTEAEYKKIISIASEFVLFLNSTTLTVQSQITSSFISIYNTTYTSNIISMTYTSKTTHQNTTVPDSLVINLNNEYNIYLWFNNTTFKTTYPDYEIDVVLPFDNFKQKLLTPTDFITALNTFDLVEFNKRIEISKEEYIQTSTQILNIKYLPPDSVIKKNCYFAFNIYGAQGDYDFILKMYLFNYLNTTLNISEADIVKYFPDLMNVNEFFIVPRWEKVAISAVSVYKAINSQIYKTYVENNDTQLFIPTITDLEYIKNNTYSLPVEYNNLLLTITNGKYSDTDYKDFLTQFGDYISIPSSNEDFSRMSTRTQNLAILIENMLNVSNSDSSVDMVAKINQNANYQFKLLVRSGISYLSVFNDRHQYYCIPKYEFMRLKGLL